MPSLSPQVQSYGQVPPLEQAEQMFKDKFTQSAYSVLFSRFADIAPNVVTFKILEADAVDGKAVGAFVVLHDNRAIYIPVVMVDGQLKPMEMFYYKDLNIFLPLNNSWLDEISKMSVDEMGQGMELPQDVPKDMSLRNIILPPLVPGRFGYASDMSHDVKKMFKEAFDHHIEIHPKFLDVLKSAPENILNGVKLAFERHPWLLQKFAKNYGASVLVSAFQTGYKNAEKSGCSNGCKCEKCKGTVKVFSKKSSAKELKDVFGKNSGQAFSEILKKGYAVSDTRPGIYKAAVKVEGPAILDSPGTSGGWFRLYFVDAPADIFFLIPWPKTSNRWDDARCAVFISGDRDTHRRPTEYLAINKDGKEAWTCSDVMGEKILNPKEVQDSKLYKIFAGEGGDTPTPESFGFFLNVHNSAVEATKPFEIKYVVDEGGRQKVIGHWGQGTYIIDDDPSRIRIDCVKQHDMVFLPKNSKWIEITHVKKIVDSSGHNPTDLRDYPSSFEYMNQRKISIIKDPKLMQRWLNAKLHEVKAESVDVKSAGLNEWWIKGSQQAFTKETALQKVAVDYEISVEDAEGILKDAQIHGISSAVILDVRSGQKLQTELKKIAQGVMTPEQSGYAPPTNQGMYGGTMPASSEYPMGSQQYTQMSGEQMIDPNTGQPIMPPSPPSMITPTDLAIAETVDQLKQQNELQIQQQQMQMQQQQDTLQQQQQSTEQLIGVLEHIQNRSRELLGVTGGMIPPGLEASPATAAGMLAPQVEEPEGPTPTPVMEGENLSPEMVADQIHPELVDQASELGDQGIFDTAALAMLSSTPGLQNIVSTYLPNMEKSLDNIGRILLSLWLSEAETKNAIGDTTYVTLEDKLSTVFRGLGDVILSLSHSVPDTNVSEYQSS